MKYLILAATIFAMSGLAQADIQAPPGSHYTSMRKLGRGNQAVDPWLDEALATYAEARFSASEASLSSREIPAVGVGRVGEPMTFWEQQPDSYFRSVYTQGAVALLSLGEPAVIDCALAHYVAANAFGIATPDALLDVLERAIPDARERLAAFGIS